MVSLSEKTLRRVDAYANKTGTTRDKIMEEALECYLDEKEKN